MAAAAADRGIRIHSVGLGTTAGTTLDLDGFSVHTRLDETLLRHIAEVTAGQYLAPDPEAIELADAVDTGAVYDAPRQHLVVSRDEHLEVTSLARRQRRGAPLVAARDALSGCCSGGGCR